MRQATNATVALKAAERGGVWQHADNGYVAVTVVPSSAAHVRGRQRVAAPAKTGTRLYAESWKLCF